MQSSKTPGTSITVAGQVKSMNASFRGLGFGLVFAIVLVGFAIWIVGFFALGVWAIYRIARGWLRLKDRQPMPA